jgi:Putative Ig domain
MPCSGRIFSSTLVVLFLTSVAGCGMGGNIPSVKVESASSSVTYPQATITATVGQAITVLTPTVTGTVSSFSISPALPAGLSLNTSTGTISGTPTAAAAQATYTVTATTSSGAVTASVQITVSSAAATGLVYPLTTIAGIVGQAITPDTPAIAGVISSYSISPALPAGLSLNPSTGTISGMPTTVTPQAFYTVTATGSGGNVNAVLQIAVIAAPNVLLKLGQTGTIQGLRMVGNRVLSADLNGHWVLWEYSSGAILAEGDGTQPKIPNPNDPVGGYPVFKPVDMAGNTAVVAGANNLQVLSAADGTLLSLIVFQGLGESAAPLPTSQTSPWWQLASDGSYLCIGSSAGLFVYSLAGQVIASKVGDYSMAQVFAAPGKVMVGEGAAGQNVIETISTANGASTVSQPFSGTFNTWFVDGTHFLTNLNNTVWVYSDSAVQQAIVDVPVGCAGGEGKWYWIYNNNGTCPYASGDGNYPLTIYAIGASDPSFTVSHPYLAALVASGGTIGLLDYAAGQVTVVDVSGSDLSKTVYTTPIINLSAYAATSPSKWMVGNQNGVLLDGAGLPGTDRYFGYGEALSIAGASNTAAISTASGKILMMDPYSRAQQEAIDFPSSEVMLSSDGSILAALSDTTNYQYESDILQVETDQTINVYSLPSRSLSHSFPDTYNGYSFPQTVVFGFTLAASGTTIGRATQTSTGRRSDGSIAEGPVIRSVTPISGRPVIWSDTDTTADTPNFDPILLSPDGTLMADNVGGNNPGASTNIVKNGKLVATVAGNAVGWIDNDRLLVNQFQYWSVLNPGAGCNGGLAENFNCHTAVFTGAVIFNSAGVQTATSPIPALTSIQPVNSSWVYNPTNNAIYSLSSGEPVWTGMYPVSGAPYAPGVSPSLTGAVAGAYVVYASGADVVVESYQ